MVGNKWISCVILHIGDKTRRHGDCRDYKKSLYLVFLAVIICKREGLSASLLYKYELLSISLYYTDNLYSNVYNN